MQKNYFNFILFVCLFFFCQLSRAGWSWNLGYHNPPTATIGINLQYFWTQTSFEFGVGNVSSNSDSASLYGYLNFKYYFTSGWLRPYLGVGTFAGAGGSSGNSNNNSSGAGVSVSGAFGTLGILLKGNPFYLSLGLNLFNKTSEFTASLGFDF